MLKLGRFNTLSITTINEAGCLLDAGSQGAIALKEAGPYQVGESIDVFLYLDSDGQYAATQQTPLAQVGEVAWLRVAAVDDIGAFLDWGLPKDLFLPFSEQRHPLKEGSYCLVKVYIDNSNRLAATTRLDKHLEEVSTGYQTGQKVSLIIADKTEMGYKAVVDHQYWGLLYDNELYQSIKKGQHIDGYIKRVREDKKLDLTLQQPGYGKVDAVSVKILEKLKQHDGHLLISDKSSPEAIKAIFGVSKKVFKQAIGSLYKQRIITIDKNSIKLNQD